MVNQVMFRASVVEYTKESYTVWDDYTPSRWTIPVLFRTWDAAVDAAVKAAQRKTLRWGGEWSVEIERERVVIV